MGTVNKEILVVLLLIPYYWENMKGLSHRQLSLSLPSITTVFILLYLGKTDLALIFTSIILLGFIFKTYILWRVKKSVTDISQKLPKTATIRRNGKEQEIQISAITLGDTLIVKSGLRVATDSKLITDSALVDESVVTGESRPVWKKKGDNLLAGSINTGNFFEARAISSPEGSTLAQIQNLVTNAQSAKAPLAEIVSKYAWTTSIIAILGVAVIYIFTKNIILALSFWVAVVPVIFAIIVPVATTIGIAILAKTGILVKDSRALESLTKVRVLLFDKTGTITKGEPEVKEIVALKTDEMTVLKIAASLDQYSDHPLAKAIVAEAARQKLKLVEFENVETLKGLGIRAKRDNKIYAIGSEFLVSRAGAVVPKNIPQFYTPVFVIESTTILGAVMLTDKLKDNAAEVLTGLSTSGKKVVVVTGDKKEVADDVSKKFPGVFFKSEISPQGKVDVVEKNVAQGNLTAMVGDGINDAPALAAASVGIAMGGKGTDLTLNAAGVILLNDDLASIPKAIKMAGETFKVIKQDVVLATLIHALTAALVLTQIINLTGAAVIHEASSVMVLLNTLRLFGPSFNLRNKDSH